MASNVCFNFDSKVFEAFKEPDGDDGLSKRLPNFQWRWVFKYENHPIPENEKDYPIIDEDGSWVIIPGWLGHTSHFAQNAIMMNYYLHHKEILPPVSVCLLVYPRCVVCICRFLTLKQRLSGL